MVRGKGNVCDSVSEGGVMNWKNRHDSWSAPFDFLISGALELHFLELE